MTNIVLNSDFVHPRYISRTNENVSDIITKLIASEEPKCIELCFGMFAQKWVYDNVPSEEDETYSVFYNGGYFTNDEGKNVSVPGIKTILVDLLYFYISQKIQFIPTSVGSVVSGENRSDIDIIKSQAIEAFNSAAEKLTAMNYYIESNSDLFVDSGIELQTLNYLNYFGI